MLPLASDAGVQGDLLRGLRRRLPTLVCAAGMAAGSIKFKGIGLGGAAVLFMGIFVAQFSQPIEPHTLSFVREFGLVLFVFTIGLSLGPGFFASLRAEGLRLNLLAAALVEQVMPWLQPCQ